jgi:hypothetical protein
MSTRVDRIRTTLRDSGQAGVGLSLEVALDTAEKAGGLSGVTSTCRRPTNWPWRYKRPWRSCRRSAWSWGSRRGQRLEDKRGARRLVNAGRRAEQEARPRRRPRPVGIGASLLRPCR